MPASKGKTEYRILSQDSLRDYLRSIPAVAEVLGQTDALTVEEIGNGNLNFVYLVRSELEPSRCVIVKQAVPYLRLAGESWPLSRSRMTYEIRALRVYNDLVPNFVPKIYHADEEMSTLVMQCLDQHVILRHGQMRGLDYPCVARHIGLFLAETLFRTSALSLNSQSRRRLMNDFNLNSELCKLTEEFIFTFPYMHHESNYINAATEAWANANLRNNLNYKLNVLRFKDLFLTKADALLHADLHTGSLMVNRDETYIIDMEFAYFGPFGFDIGKIIANFLMSATSHLYLSADRSYSNQLLAQACQIWDVFEWRFLQLWDEADASAMLTPGLLDSLELSAFKKRFMADMLRQSVGFAACSIARRMLGIAGVADIREIPDLAIRSQLEIVNLKLSVVLMGEHANIGNITDLSQLLDGFYSSQPAILGPPAHHASTYQ